MTDFALDFGSGPNTGDTLEQAAVKIVAELNSLAALIGTGTPTPGPSFTSSPTITSDGTPQVGEQLTGVDGAVAALGGNTLTRQWLLGTTVLASTANFTPTQTGVHTFQNRVLDGQGNALATASATLTVSAATPTPTPGTYDPTLPVPTLANDVDGSGNTLAGTFPPHLVFTDPGNTAQADSIGYRLQRAATSDIAFASPTLVAAAVITNAQATGNAITGTGLSSISTPQLYRMRFESADGLRYGDWSNTLLHGDTTAPVLTSSVSFSGAENAKMVAQTTYNKPVTRVIGGQDAAALEPATTGAQISHTTRLANDGYLNFEAKPTYTWTETATDLAGNVTVSTFAFTVTDQADLPTAPVFTSVASGATANTVYTSNTVTIAGMAAGIVGQNGYVDAGTLYSKNGGPFVSTPFSYQLGDTFAVRTTTGSANGSYTATIHFDTVAAIYSARVGSASAGFDPARLASGVTLSNNNLTATLSGKLANTLIYLTKTLPRDSNWYYYELYFTGADVNPGDYEGACITQTSSTATAGVPPGGADGTGATAVINYNKNTLSAQNTVFTNGGSTGGPAGTNGFTGGHLNFGIMMCGDGRVYTGADPKNGFGAQASAPSLVGNIQPLVFIQDGSVTINTGTSPWLLGPVHNPDGGTFSPYSL